MSNGDLPGFGKLPDDLQNCLELVHAQHAPVVLQRWEVLGFEDGVLRLSPEPSPDEGWVGGHLTLRTPERELVLEGEILHFDPDNAAILVDGINWGDGFTPSDFDGKRLSYDPIPYGKALTKAYEILNKATEGLLGERLKGVLGAAAPGISFAVGAAVAENQASGNVALDLWDHKWGIVWGPPGTGKTECLADALAHVGATTKGKVLILAPTHRAVNEITSRVCQKMSKSKTLFDKQGNCRVFRGGRGVDDELLKAFPQVVGKDAHLESRSTSGVEQMRRRLQRLIRSNRHGEVAKAARELKAEFEKVRDETIRALEAGPQKLIFATVQKALSLVASQESLPVVSKVLVDEAGMVSRAACLAASCLGETVLLAGDPKQIGPICPARVGLSLSERKWLTHSALSHLKSPAALPKNVRFLECQHRMHPDICRAVSRFTYDGLLRDAEGVAERTTGIILPKGFPTKRAAFVVLDELAGSPNAAAHSRAKGKGYERRTSARIVAALALAAVDKGLQCLALTAYRAQVRLIRNLVEKKYDGPALTVGTIHRQQGAERDVVILDLVNAATAWKDEEIEMLLNVALSRARASFILIASRAELKSRVLRRFAAHLQEDAISVTVVDEEGQQALNLRSAGAPVKLETASAAGLALTLGDEIRALKQRLPLYSEEQLELIERNLGQGHYLVRGVAGSGKTLVLANWALRHLQRRPKDRVLITYFNKGLSSMLSAMLESVRKSLWIEKGLLDNQLEVQWVGRVDPDRTFEAVFVDEAQDILSNDLARLHDACEPRPNGKGQSLRSFILFSDDSQNIYGRETLEELKGRLSEDFSFSGRSFVLQETYRSTRAILDLSLNLALDPKAIYGPAKSGLLGYFKVAELANKGLLQRAEESADGLYHVHYTDRVGVKPEIVMEANVGAVAQKTAILIKELIQREAVDPSDIMVVSVHKPGIFAAALRAQGIPAKAFGGTGNEPPEGMPAQDHKFVRCTTVFSCKGHESPVVVFGNVQDVENLSWMKDVRDFEKVRRCLLYVAASRAMVKLYLVGAPCKAMEAAAHYA
ncbi:MAG: AAA domain-containing protein [Elusimicrobia bacterium]|nr:AAA domain-containing protein [Elusimicrobiota bacterium]